MLGVNPSNTISNKRDIFTRDTSVRGVEYVSNGYPSERGSAVSIMQPYVHILDVSPLYATHARTRPRKRVQGNSYQGTVSETLRS